MAQLTNILDLEVGDIVDFYSAKFEIISTKIVMYDGDQVMVAHAKWLSGNEVPFYFGPDKDWTFQGNHHVEYLVTKP